MSGERGFTLVETMVAIAILGIIAVVLGMVVQQMVTVPEQGNEQVEASHDLQNVIHWLSLDGVAAQSAVGGDSLEITLPDSSVVTYERSGNTLYRYDETGNLTLAQSISSVNFTINDRVIVMDITAAPDSRWNTSANQTYQVAMRPTEN